MIDDHAHPFGLQYAALDLDAVSLDVEAGTAAEGRRRRLGAGRVFAELLRVALADLLDVGAEDAVAARDQVAAHDWRAWVRCLFDDADIEGLVLDEGVSTAQDAGAEALAGITGRPVWRLARVDPLVDELIGRGAGAKEVVDAVEQFMAEAAAAGAVGFKTVLAYRTGLAVDPDATLAAADASLDASVPVRRRAKPLRDLVTRVLLARAADLGRPVQFHTGFGDSELRLAESDPLLLEDLLRTPEGAAAAVVLIHGSHPWPEQAGYLASTKPNVYAELSLSNLFAPTGTADRLLRLIDMAPREKVLVGSDGHGVPETHWFASRTLRRGFDDVAARLRASGARASWIEETRQAVFGLNARSLYRLAS